jgi:hypothetical protein
LAGQRTETASSTDDGDELAGPSTRLLQALVDGDTGAENGSDGGEVAVLGDARHVCSFGNAVLLESAVDSVTRKEGLGAQWLVGRLAELAGQAGSVEPLDTGVVANLDVVDELALGDYDTCTLVASDKR